MTDLISNHGIQLDLQTNFIQTRNGLTIPRVILSTFPVQPRGSLVYDITTKDLYYSDGVVWLPVDGSNNLNIIVDTVTCAPKADLSISPSASVIPANVNVALVSRGTGAFTLNQPDGLVTGGNCRGDQSVDLQLSRTLASQVTSGLNSFAAGLNNTVSSTAGVALGTGSIVTHSNSLVYSATTSRASTAVNEVTFGAEGGFRILAGGSLGAVINLDGPVTVPGKLTVGGVIDPTGLVLDQQVSVPQVPLVTQGAVWTQNTIPTELIFTNSALQGYQLLPELYSQYDAIIPLQYPTVQAAYADGKRCILVNSNTTEVSPIVLVDAELYIFITCEVTWTLTSTANLQNNTIANVYNVTIEGEGYNSTLNYSPTVNNINMYQLTLIDGSSASALRISKLTFRNVTTFNDTRAINGGTFQCQDCQILLGNASNQFYNPSSSSGDCIISNIFIVGGGGACVSNIVTINGTIDNIIMSGTFLTPSFEIGENTSAANFISNANVGSIITVSGTLKNFRDMTSIGTIFAGDGSSVIISNAYGLTLLSNNTVSPSDSVIISNVQANTVELIPGRNEYTLNGIHQTGIAPQVIGGASHHFTNCTWNADLSLTGTDCKFNNCRFSGNVSLGTARNSIENCIIDVNSATAINVTASFNRLVGNRVGTSAGGGIGTIDITGAATGTIVSNCHTDAAITDAGVGSALSNNVVY